MNYIKLANSVPEHVGPSLNGQNLGSVAEESEIWIATSILRLLQNFHPIFPSLKLYGMWCRRERRQRRHSRASQTLSNWRGKQKPVGKAL
jgi:hypothetical protein